MAKLADAFVSIRIDTSKLSAGLSKAKDTIKKGIGANIGRKIGRKIGRALGRAISKGLRASMRGVARTIKGLFLSITRTVTRAAIGIAAAIAAIGVSSIKLAAEVQESENLFEASMGNMAKSSRAFSDNISKQLGLFAPDLRKMIGVFNLMFKAMDIGEAKAADMAQTLSVLAQDMASFRDLAPDEIFLKLRSGITGESEPLKQLGIIINETQTKMFAFEKGIGTLRKKGKGLTGTLTEQEKVLARYGLILKLTTQDQGDLAKTFDSLTNRARTLGNTWRMLRLAIGGIFLADTSKAFFKLTKLIQANQVEIVAFIKKIRVAVVEWIEDQGGITGIWEKVLIVMADVKSYVTGTLVPAFQTLLNIVLKAAEVVGNLSGSFTPAFEKKLLKNQQKKLQKQFESPESAGGTNITPKELEILRSVTGSLSKELEDKSRRSRALEAAKEARTKESPGGSMITKEELSNIGAILNTIVFTLKDFHRLEKSRTAGM